MTERALKLIENENRGIDVEGDGNEELAIFAGGEYTQRVNDLPKFRVQDIIKNAVSTIKSLPSELEA